jgi:hypothetical protein
MSFMSYSEVRPWAKSIKQQVVSRTMPPWFATHDSVEFSNNPTLSDKEVDTINRWVAAGSPKGDDKDMPAAPKFVQGWTAGTPDAIVSMGEEYTVPADGEVPYLYFTIPTNFKEDRWLQAIEIRPSSPSVVHHVIAFTDGGGTAAGGGQGDQRGRVNIGGITPNKTALIFPNGHARLLKAGSNIVLQMHYTTNGKVTTDRTSVGLFFTKQTPKKLVVTANAMNGRFVIPAGDGNHEVKASTTFREDTWLTSFMPHMHVRGKDFKYTAVFPDGTSKVLLDVPKYNFNWQLTYSVKEPIFLPKGTRLDCVAHFDNSINNKYNPDPSKEVRWGDQTWEEMMIGWFTTIKDIDAPARTETTASTRQ